MAAATGRQGTGQLPSAVQGFIGEVRAAFETETTIGRILGRVREALERLLAHPGCLAEVEASLGRVRACQVIPYGQPIDEEGYGSWKLYTDPDHLFCLRAHHRRPGHRRSPHDHGELGWAVYGVLTDGTVQQLYERLDDGSQPGRARLRPLPEIRQRAGQAVILPVGTPHAVTVEREAWAIVIRSGEMERQWRNWYDVEAGTVERKVFGYG